MTTTDNSRAAVRVCTIADAECSRNCDTGSCKRETSPVEQHEAAPMKLKAQLRRAMDLLDTHLGDSDPMLEGLTQDEIENAYPAVAAMQIIVSLHQEMGQHEAAPAGMTSEDAKEIASFLVPAFRHAQLAPTAPLEGTGNGADERAAYNRDVFEPAKAMIVRLGECHRYSNESAKRQVHRDAGMLIAKLADTLSRAPRTEVAGAVPEGWKLVPIEPTMEMLIAARKADREYQQRMGQPDYIGVGAYDHYCAMLESAPAYSVKNGDDEMRSAWSRRYGRSEWGHEQTAKALYEDGWKDCASVGAPQPPSADAAAAPVDERAVKEAGAPTGIYDGDTPESRAAFREYDLRELARTRSKWQVWRDACAWQARAAASQPAAEPAAAIVREWFAGRDRWDVKIFDRTLKHGAKLYTAPPAQVAIRQGLTDALRQAREELSNVEWENDPPARITDLFSTIDALLEGAKHA